MIDTDLESRIMSSMTKNRYKLKMAAIEELVELAKVIVKSERLGENYRDRKTGEEFIDMLVNEVADVFITLIGISNEYNIKSQVIDKINDICWRYEQWNKTLKS